MYNRDTDFGLSALVFRFNEAQIEVVRSITENRLLMETESPYLSVGRNLYNTPADRGATLRGNTLTKDIIDISRENGLRLYN